MLYLGKGVLEIKECQPARCEAKTTMMAAIMSHLSMQIIFCGSLSCTYVHTQTDRVSQVFSTFSLS